MGPPERNLPPSGLELEAEASRVRLRLLEAFWLSSGLAARERRARLDAVLQESVSRLDSRTRDQVVERVLQELARWEPASGPESSGAGDVVREALAACLAGKPDRQARLSPEDQRLIDCVAAMVEHLDLESQQHENFLKDVAKEKTHLLPRPFLQSIQAAASPSKTTDAAPEMQRLRDLLRRLQLSRNILFSAARVAGAKALARLLTDLDPRKFSPSEKVNVKRAWEDFEKAYEDVTSLGPDGLRDKYFSDFYREEFKTRSRT